MLKLFNDDCIKIMENMESKSVTCTITDIPYDGVNRKSNGLRNLDKGNADILTFDLDMFLNEVLRITNGSIYIFCGHNQVSEIYKKFAEEGLSTRVIVWEKTNPSPMNGQHVWLNGVELCVYAKFKNATFNEHCKNTVFRFPLSEIRTTLHLNLLNFWKSLWKFLQMRAILFLTHVWAGEVRE